MDKSETKKKTIREWISLFMYIPITISGLIFPYWFTRNKLFSVIACLLISGFLVLEVLRQKSKILNVRTPTYLFIIMQILTIVISLLLPLGSAYVFVNNQTLNVLQMAIASYILILFFITHVNAVAFDLSNKKRPIIYINRTFYIISLAISFGICALFLAASKADVVSTLAYAKRINFIFPMIGALFLGYIELVVFSSTKYIEEEFPLETKATILE